MYNVCLLCKRLVEVYILVPVCNVFFNGHYLIRLLHELSCVRYAVYWSIIDTRTFLG